MWCLAKADGKGVETPSEKSGRRLPSRERLGSVVPKLAVAARKI
jgi:hypothetical protein